MPDLCVLADLKDWLQIDLTDVSQDARLQRLITAISADFVNRINRPGFMPDSDYTELIEVMNCQSESRFQEIFLSNWPVNSVTCVSLNDVDLPEFDSLAPEVLGWVFDDTRAPESRQSITLRGLHWPVPRCSPYRPAPLRVKVSYTAGYDEVPADVAQAVIEWAAFKKGLAELQSADQSTQWVQMGQFQQNSSIATSSLKASAVDMPISVAQVISQYKRPVTG
jgi:hypothetical protein